MCKIFISAGEASGDLLGANLARALLQKNPALHLTGMGGKKMRDAGVGIQFDSNQLAVVGFFEILKKLFPILHTLHTIKKYLQHTKPDLIILIDFPDTHFRVMKYAKKLGIPVLYYVSPQIWAWRSGRIKQIKKYVDHMAVLFSFEEKIYRDAQVPVTFVGHALSTLAKPTMSKEAAYDFFNLTPDKKIVALFPGSRDSELKNHLPLILEATKKIQECITDVQLVLVLANHFNQNHINVPIPNHIRIIQNNLYDLLQITDAAIAASGTVTLEIGLMQTPLCIIYRFSAFTFWLAKKLVRIKYIGLCNIVAEKLIAKELIQDQATPENIARETIKLLSDKNNHDAMKKEFSQLKNKITAENSDASENVSEIAFQLIKDKKNCRPTFPNR